MPTDRATTLYDDAAGQASLRLAWRQVRRKKGGPGGDGMTIEAFAVDLDKRLARLSASLQDGSYRPGAHKRYPIEKANGGRRWLAIPTVADRVAQGAFARAISIRLDHQMADASFAYRPGRSVEFAIGRVLAYRLWGFSHVVDADITCFFDRVPHYPLVRCLEATLDCRRTVMLVARWLESFTWWRHGLAQGSPISPILANLYLAPIDRAFAGKRIKIVRYADNLLLFCRNRRAAEAASQRLACELQQLNLALNPDKTRITDFTTGFGFLGYRFDGERISRLPT